MIRRIRGEIRGIVQGVGFRPFVYRLAHAFGLTGWVCNSSRGVNLEAEGQDSALDAFVGALTSEAPPLALISTLEWSFIPPAGDGRFVIRTSAGGEKLVEIAPDGDVCPDCLGELFDPGDRRYRYPFICCTNCGPRYSIITATPYDRPLTTMAPFAMCPECRAEYHDPGDRRFHAQPTCCPACGPRLLLVDPAGRQVDADPLTVAVLLLREGKILAVKGAGGYHLAVDAANDRAVRELRRRKRRDEKPFALMASDTAEVRKYASPEPCEERLLASPERPVVLVRKRPDSPLVPAVAPVNGYLGFMLPNTPLQHLLLREHCSPLVMTSGNSSDEPIAFRDGDARQRLGGIADFFLTHDREIRTRLDDSVIRVFQGAPLFLRRSRGYAPRAISLPTAQPRVLAVGADLKGAACLTRDDRAFLSQHIGDLANPATLASLAETSAHLSGLLEIEPELIAHDLHPDYHSTRWAEEIAAGRPTFGVQHHHAHLAACMAENGLEGEVIGVIFDGTGYGSDGTVWGGEFLVGGYERFQRSAHLRQVPLPGGDAAVRAPYRMALSWLREAFGPEAFDLPLPFVVSLAADERKLLDRMIERQLNAPLTSSCGRLFDAVAAILGVRDLVNYEGQAAIELEGLAERGAGRQLFHFEVVRGAEEKLLLDMVPAIRELTEAVLAGEDRATLARAFHGTLAAGAAEVCAAVRDETGLDRVVLSGGVFQNRLLAEELHDLLAARGFKVVTHRLVPPNDGGVALGQAVIAGRSGICA